MLWLLEKPVIQRDLYVDKLYTHALTGQIVFVLGSRRVGKSSLINALYQKYHLDQVFYLNLEFDSTKQLHTLEALNTAYDNYVAEYGEPKRVIIDEIQYVPDRQYFVRARFTTGKHKIIITGSHSSLIHNKLSEYFTGRFVSLLVHPLVYREFLLFCEAVDSLELFEEYLQYGGLPEVVLLPKDKKAVYLKQTLQSLLFEDMMKQHNLSDALLLEKIIGFIADSIGSELSINSIVNYLKQSMRIGAQTISTYLIAALDAFLIHKHSRYDIKGKKILEFNEKYYFFDHGLRNMVRGLRPDDTAKLLENIVCHELMVRDYEVFIGKYHDSEIDFVAIQNNKKTFIQVTQTIDYPETYHREFGNLEKIRQAGEMFVLSMSGLQTVSDTNISHYPMRKWLLGEV